MTVQVAAKTVVNAPASVVWDILDDFENVELHSDLEGSEWKLGDGRCRVLATRAASP